MASKKPSLAGEGLGLFTDFVQGLRTDLKKAGGNDQQLEALRDKKIIAAIVSLIMAPVQAVLEFLDRTVSVTMDLSKSVAQLIADGGYNWVHPDIAKRFGFATGEGFRTTEIHLLHYNKYMTTEQVVVDMDRQGLRPATFQELLWIGIQHPRLQLDFPIIALGTVVGVRGGRHVAYLGRFGAERDLRLDCYGDGWYEPFRFAAVRK